MTFMISFGCYLTKQEIAPKGTPLEPRPEEVDDWNERVDL
jgi:hypothetical protein